MVDLLGHKFSMAFLINNKRVLAYTIHYTPKLAKEHLRKIKRFHNLEGRIVFDNNLEERFERIIRDRIFKDHPVNVELDNYRYKEVYSYLLKLQLKASPFRAGMRKV